MLTYLLFILYVILLPVYDMYSYYTIIVGLFLRRVHNVICRSTFTYNIFFFVFSVHSVLFQSLS